MPEQERDRIAKIGPCRKERENMKPIYEPKSAAKEYGDFALNIYTGCPHRCFYCYAPRALHCDREKFHSVVEPRKNIAEETQKQLERENITEKTIHLCFTCDPYPTGYDSAPTRKIIRLLKEYGNHVQILTKGGRELRLRFTRRKRLVRDYNRLRI